MNLQVTCGSVIKLENDKTRHVLHSHDVSYGGGRGSGQQSVTGYPEKDKSQSLWIVRGADVSLLVLYHFLTSHQQSGTSVFFLCFCRATACRELQ